MRIGVKIFSYKSPQRYAVRRAVLAAQAALRREYSDLLVEIAEVRECSEIEKVTPVVIYPSLAVNDWLVCVGRFPNQDEILVWFQQALQEA